MKYKYIRIKYKNIEPIRISDDSSSQNGQTNTLTYIPGSAMRGVIVNTLMHKPDFESIKKNLFSDQICFLNGYPLYEKEDGFHELLPALKGFYENGAETKKLENFVLSENITPGNKKADVKDYCYPAGKELVCFKLTKNTDTKITTGRDKKTKKNVFRCQYIKAGYTFVSYIAVQNDDMIKKISECLETLKKDSLYIGNARSSGFGKCQLQAYETTHTIPYQEYAELGELQNYAYMLLLSDTAMINQYGENIGIDLPSLENQLDTKLEIETCASSVQEVRGYNRKWGIKIPSVKMYGRGSVFKLRLHEPINEKNLLKLYDEGIGIRRNEGFGRVIFLKNYTEITEKREMAFTIYEKDEPDICNTLCLTPDDETVLTLFRQAFYKKKLDRALKQYISEHPLKYNGSFNQLGTIRAYASVFQFQPQEALAKLTEYIEHCEKKDNTQKEHSVQNTRDDLVSWVRFVLESNILNILLPNESREYFMKKKISDIIGEPDRARLKLRLLIETIDTKNREAKQDGGIL